MVDISAIRVTPAELEAINAAFTLKIADATKEAIQQRLGLLPPPDQSVVAELARREAEAAKGKENR